MSKYRCSICGFSNDPTYYAMRKVGRRWFHLICMERVMLYAISHYDIKLDGGLRIIKFDRKEDEVNE